MIPIFVLLLLKLLADNFVTGFVVILCTTSFYRLKAAFELELALKDRSNRLNLFGLLLGSLGLLWAIITEINLLSFHDSIGNRMIFHFPESKLRTDPSLGNTLWSCIVTDGIAQLSVLVIKILVVNMIGLHSHVQRSGFKCPTGQQTMPDFNCTFPLSQLLFLHVHISQAVHCGTTVPNLPVSVSTTIWRAEAALASPPTAAPRLPSLLPYLLSA